MGKPQIIHTEGGEELVVIPLADYERLLEHAGDDIEDALEEDFIRRIVAESEAAIARGEDVALPIEVWRAIEGGESAVRVLRKYRGLTQVALAENAGVSQAYLSEIEKGRKVGTAETLRAIAHALAVPISVLVE